MIVNTKTAPRRTLAFTTFEDILAEIDRIQSALDSGTAAHTGNWTVGEICDHCAKFIGFACDGFGSLAPAPLRFVFRLLFYKKAMGPDPMPSGFKLPKQASALLPEPSIPDQEGLDNLRKEVKRVIAGKEMTHPSPVFGKMTHEKWVLIQTKHCAMHMGFIAYPDA